VEAAGDCADDVKQATAATEATKKAIDEKEGEDALDID
jgi:hypothetical protein